MSFVRKLTTNIKSPDGEDYTVDLGKNTILIGNNESGKSAIAEAVELARTGSAFGLLYRDKPVKDGGLLSALIPLDCSSAHATAVLDDEQECSWTLVEGKRPVRSGPNGASLSVAGLHAILAGSEETKAKFFWSKLCALVDKEKFKDDWLDGSLHEVVDQISPPNESELSLSDLLSKIGAAQREQSAAKRASRIVLESLGSVREPTDDELDGAQAAIDRALTRDVLRDLYTEDRENPGLQAREVLRHLIEMLGGQDAVKRIPETYEARANLEDALLGRRLTKTAVLAKKGETAALIKEERLKQLKGEIMEAIHRDFRVSKAVGDFRKRVNSYLPRGERICFSPLEGKLVIGLRKGATATGLGTLHTALSGSTEARVIAALAAALADSADDLLVVDDRMWDSPTLAKTMKALEKAPCQVLIMSTMKPRGKKRSNWQYVELTRTEGEPLGIAGND